MIRKLILVILAVSYIQLIFAQDDDFGYDLSISGETKIVNNLKLEIYAGMRTQDDAKKTDRFTVGGELAYKLYTNQEKTFNVKANAGFEYLWTQILGEKKYKFETDENNGNDILTDTIGYSVTDKYWRNRHRTSIGFSANYNPNKRWSFSLKETFRYYHYCKVDSIGRTKWKYNDDAELYSIVDPTSKIGKDLTTLRSKLTIGYDIKGFPIDVFASVDYGCGLNYSADKWKFNGGFDYKINNDNVITLSYRYNTENDDDEGNGHLIGLGYKFNF